MPIIPPEQPPGSRQIQARQPPKRDSEHDEQEVGNEHNVQVRHRPVGGAVNAQKQAVLDTKQADAERPGSQRYYRLIDGEVRQEQGQFGQEQQTKRTYVAKPALPVGEGQGTVNRQPGVLEFVLLIHDRSVAEANQQHAQPQQTQVIIGRSEEVYLVVIGGI